MRRYRNYWALTGAIGVVVPLAFIMHQHDSNRPLTSLCVSERPLGIEPYPVNQAIDSESLGFIMGTTRPYFFRPDLASRTPSSLVIHAAKLWGPSAEFPHAQRKRNRLSALSGAKMFDILLNHNAYAEHSQYESEGMLFRSPFGIRAATSSDGAHGGRDTSTHYGKIVQVCAEHGISSSQPVQPAQGEAGSLADIIRDDAARLTTGCEIDFIANGLCRYAVDGKPWINRFGQEVSFDTMAYALVDSDVGGGTCNGTAMLYSLCVLSRAHTQRPILSSKAFEAVRDKLVACSTQMTRVQLADGSWDWDWAISCNLTQIRQSPPRSSLLGKVLTTGHHLEWMSLAPPECRPPDESIKLAATFLVRSWPDVVQCLSLDWHNYPMATHAARALWLLSGSPSLVDFQNLPNAEVELALPSMKRGAWSVAPLPK